MLLDILKDEESILEFEVIEGNVDPELIMSESIFVKLKNNSVMILSAKYDYMGEEKGQSVFASNEYGARKIPHSDVLGIYDSKGNRILPPLFVKPRPASYGVGLHNFMPVKINKIYNPSDKN